MNVAIERFFNRGPWDTTKRLDKMVLGKFLLILGEVYKIHFHLILLQILYLQLKVKL